MASKGIADDPLRGGGAFDDQDMEDLTAHLAGLPTGRSSHEGLDLGDNSELLQGNLDRFRALAGDDSSADELFTSYGGLGIGLGVSDSTIITTTNYPTYGELAAAKPPSYEDSIMYEQAPPLGMHVAAAAAAAGDDPFLSGGHGQAFGGGGGHAGPWTSLSAFPPISGLLSDPLQQPPLSTTNGGLAPRSGQNRDAGGLAAAALAPPSPAAGPPVPLPLPAATGGGAAASTSAAIGAHGGGGGGFGGAGLDPLLLLGGVSSEVRMDDLQVLPSPERTSPTRGPARGLAGGGGAGGSSLQRHQQLITVSDPIKREQGGIFGIKGGYVTYQVRTRARPGGAAAAGGEPNRPETSVRRRFREFVALADVLKEEYRGYFVPPRPDKNAVEGQRMTDAFVEERRLALERYLNKLARHPVIGASEVLRLFLEVEGELADSAAWLALRPVGQGGSVLGSTARFSKQVLGLDRAVTDPLQAAQPTKKASDFMRAIKETAQRMQQPAPSPAALPADELVLVRAREEVESLQGALTSASRAAENLVARLDRWAIVHGALGLALIAMRNAEKAEGVALANHTGTLKQSGTLMHDTERLGTALVRSSRIGRKVTGRCAMELGCLHEYLGLMPAALKGLRARDKALLTADTLQSELEGRRRAITELEAAGAKVLGGDAAKAKKVAELSGDVAVLEQSVAAARGRYEAIKAVNNDEVSRLRGELRGELRAMLGHTAAIMSACAQRNLEIWLQAAGELGASSEQLQAAKASLVGGTAGHPQLQPSPPPQQ